MRILTLVLASLLATGSFAGEVAPTPEQIETKAIASEHFKALTEVKDGLEAADLVLEIARINTDLEKNEVTPKEAVFLRERCQAMQEALAIRLTGIGPITELPKAELADLKIRFRWIGEALRQGRTTLDMPGTEATAWELQGVMDFVTMRGSETVNPHLARALHDAYTALGLEVEVPNKIGSGWFGYDVGGDPAY